MSTPPARLVAVEAELEVDPQRVGPAAVGPAPACDARSSAAISLALSTECAAYAQPAIDRALLR